VGVAILAVSAAPVRVHVYARTALARTALDHDRQLFFFFFNKTTTSRSRDGSQQQQPQASNTDNTDSTTAGSASRKGRPETQPNNPALP
jgi:hypothetical protein